MAFTGVRNSCVMFERNRDFSSSARRRWSALLVQLGIERDDAAIGVFELAIEAGELLLLALERRQAPRSSSWFCCWSSSSRP